MLNWRKGMGKGKKEKQIEERQLELNIRIRCMEGKAISEGEVKR